MGYEFKIMIRIGDVLLVVYVKVFNVIKKLVFWGVKGYMRLLCCVFNNVKFGLFIFIKKVYCFLSYIIIKWNEWSWWWINFRYIMYSFGNWCFVSNVWVYYV